MRAIIIPYRGTVNDKSRLRSNLKDTSVEDLLYHMTQNLVDEISKIESSFNLYILTKKEELDFSGCFSVLQDKGEELNESLKEAFKEVQEDIIIIIMADLPLIKSEDLQFILNKYTNEKNIMLGPTPDNGTSIIACRTVPYKSNGFVFTRSQPKNLIWISK